MTIQSAIQNKFDKEFDEAWNFWADSEPEMRKQLVKSLFHSALEEAYKLGQQNNLESLLGACPPDGTQIIKGPGGIYYAEFIDHSVMPYQRTHFAQGSTPNEAVENLIKALDK